MESLSYVLVPSPFGVLALLWRDTPAGPRVYRVLLPRDGKPTQEMFQVLRAIGHAQASPAMVGLGKRITRFLEGEDFAFPLDILSLETCSEFQQRVLRAEHAIPRGWVSTYGRIAGHLGMPGAARAVGAALAHNPFPILIPCHRAIRADWTVGGYQGGTRMKRSLLKMEGIKILAGEKVVTNRIFYSA